MLLGVLKPRWLALAVLMIHGNRLLNVARDFRSHPRLCGVSLKTYLSVRSMSADHTSFIPDKALLEIVI